MDSIQLRNLVHTTTDPKRLSDALKVVYARLETWEGAANLDVPAQLLSLYKDIYKQLKPLHSCAFGAFVCNETESGHFVLGTINGPEKDRMVNYCPICGGKAKIFSDL